MKRDSIDEYAKLIPQSKLVMVAPFISKNMLDELATHKLDEERIKNNITLSPFLSEDAINLIVDYCLDNNLNQLLKSYLPFINTERFRSKETN